MNHATERAFVERAAQLTDEFKIAEPAGSFLFLGTLARVIARLELRVAELERAVQCRR